MKANGLEKKFAPTMRSLKASTSVPWIAASSGLRVGANLNFFSKTPHLFTTLCSNKWKFSLQMAVFDRIKRDFRN